MFVSIRFRDNFYYDSLTNGEWWLQRRFRVTAVNIYLFFLSTKNIPWHVCLQFVTNMTMTPSISIMSLSNQCALLMTLHGDPRGPIVLYKRTFVKFDYQFIISVYFVVTYEESAQENVRKILCKTRFSLYARTSAIYGASHSIYSTFNTIDW